VPPSLISCNSFIINKASSDPALKVVTFKEYHLFISRVLYGCYGLIT
jgi:hypothetical protein